MHFYLVPSLEVTQWNFTLIMGGRKQTGYHPACLLYDDAGRNTYRKTCLDSIYHDMHMWKIKLSD